MNTTTANPRGEWDRVGDKFIDGHYQDTGAKNDISVRNAGITARIQGAEENSLISLRPGTLSRASDLQRGLTWRDVAEIIELDFDRDGKATVHNAVPSIEAEVADYAAHYESMHRKDKPLTPGMFIELYRLRLLKGFTEKTASDERLFTLISREAKTLAMRALSASQPPCSHVDSRKLSPEQRVAERWEETIKRECAMDLITIEMDRAFYEKVARKVLRGEA